MKLIERINADFKAAYLAKEMAKKDFLGVLKTEVTKESKEPEDSYVISKIKAMIKNAEATNSLVDFELEILNGYLPTQLTEAELTTIIESQVAENGYKHIGDMGKIMTFLKNEHGGLYDGAIASKIIKATLS